MTTPETPTQGTFATVGAPDEWLAEHPIGAFIRWFPEMEASEAKIFDHLSAAVGIQPGMTVLDVASGAGIPALRVAEAVGPAGRVVATDPSDHAIAAIMKNARERNLNNVEAVRASSAGLPFPPQNFDAVVCNFGVMFFEDITMGLTRIREVLRPGRRAAFAAWGAPADNKMLGTFMQTAARYLPEPPPSPLPGALHPMRFAEPGSLSAELTTAGFRDVREDQPILELTWPCPPQRVLDVVLDVSRVEDNIPVDRQAAFRQEILAVYNQFARGEETHIPARVVIASGAAPGE